MPGSILAPSDWSVFDENAWLGKRGLLAVAAAGLVGRILIQVRWLRSVRTPLSPFAMAYLAGGAQRVVWAVLAGLRALGGLSVTSDHTGRARLQVAASPPYGDPVALVVHRAVSRGVVPSQLSRVREVASAMEFDKGSMIGDGLLLTPGRRRAARIVGVVGGIGAVLVGTIVALVGLVLFSAPVDDRAIGAGRVLAFHRKRYPLDGESWYERDHSGDVGADDSLGPSEWQWVIDRALCPFSIRTSRKCVGPGI